MCVKTCSTALEIPHHDSGKEKPHNVLNGTYISRARAAQQESIPIAKIFHSHLNQLYDNRKTLTLQVMSRHSVPVQVHLHGTHKNGPTLPSYLSSWKTPGIRKYLWKKLKKVMQKKNNRSRLEGWILQMGFSPKKGSLKINRAEMVPLAARCMNPDCIHYFRSEKITFH